MDDDHEREREHSSSATLTKRKNSSATSLLWRFVEQNDRSLLVHAIESGAHLNSQRGDHTPLKGDKVGSAALFDEVFGVFHRLLGKNHPLTAQATAALAQLRWNCGDLVGAESLLQEALASRRRALGDRHVITTETRRDLNEVQQALKKQ
jgi:hypothetical protein